MARGMLIFVSDIHLTDELAGPQVSRAEQFERFFLRVAQHKLEQPATLCFVGDLFDLVRSPKWLETDLRPYHEPAESLASVVYDIVLGVLDREAEFFTAIRRRVEAGTLNVHYLLGNHDRLLAAAPAARRVIHKALTGRDEDATFPLEMSFPRHGVLAYHGNTSDFINHSTGNGSTIGDAIGSELILRFPHIVRSERGVDIAHLDDIDDVRPIYAVPAWVRQLTRDKERLKVVTSAWTETVDSFLQNHFVKDWMREHHRAFKIDAGKKLKLLLELSTGRIMAKTHDQRLTRLYKFFQHAFDGKMVRHGAAALEARSAERLSYVVNGHSHFPTMVPLGQVGGRAGAYFNTGTWRTVHQIAHHLGGRPSFLAYDAMTYLVFFPDDDPLRRNYEWWTGAMVPRGATDAAPSPS